MGATPLLRLNNLSELSVQLEDGIAVVGIMKGDGLDHRTADFGQRHAGIK